MPTPRFPGTLGATTTSTPEVRGGDQADRDPGRRDRRHADGEPPQARLRAGRGGRSPSSTGTTATSTSRASCSSRSASPTQTRSSAPGNASCGRASVPRDGIDHVALDDDRVHLADGHDLDYDVLIVATGTRLAPEETEGLTGPGWNENVFTFYTTGGRDGTRGGADRVRGRQARREHRRHADQVPGRPDRVLVPRRLVPARVPSPRPGSSCLATPLDGCFTKPIASKHLTYLLEEKEIEL